MNTQPKLFDLPFYLWPLIGLALLAGLLRKLMLYLRARINFTFVFDHFSTFWCYFSIYLLGCLVMLVCVSVLFTSAWQADNEMLEAAGEAVIVIYMLGLIIIQSSLWILNKLDGIGTNENQNQL